MSIIASQVSKDIINSGIGLARNELLGSIGNVNESLNKMYTHTEDLKKIRSDIRNIQSSIINTKNDIDKITKTLEQFDGAMGELDGMIADIHNINKSIEDSINKLETSIEFLSALNGSEEVGYELSEALEILRGMRPFPGDLSKIISDSKNQISSIREQLNVKGAVNRINTINSQMTSVINRLDSIISLIEGSVDDINNIKNYLKEKIDETPQKYQEPVKTSLTGFFGNKNYINFMFPTIIITILMWISVFLSSVAFIKQRNRGILKRMSISPTGSSTIIMEKILLYSIISLLFLPPIFVLGVFVFGVEIVLYKILPIVIIYMLASMIFVLQGLVIGSVTRSENAATLSSLMLVVPMMFLSGTFFPVESLPWPIQYCAPYMPINISINLIEGFFFYQFTLIQMLSSVGRMLIYLIVYGIVAWLFLVRNIKK